MIFNFFKPNILTPSQMSHLDKPRKDQSDVIYTVTKAVISSIPVIGGASAEIFSALITPPVEKRKERWINDIVDQLQELEGRVDNLTIENIFADENFITTLLQATQIAIRNHQVKKLEALRNVVLNSALPEAPDIDLQLMFLQLVDELTVSHINLLSFLNNPQQWCEKNQTVVDTDIDDFIRQVLPINLVEEREYFYQKIVIDLQSRGLLNSLNDGVKRLASRAKWRREKEAHSTEPEKIFSQEEVNRNKYLDLIATIKSIKMGGSSGVFTTKFGKLFLDFLISPIDKLESSGSSIRSVF